MCPSGSLPLLLCCFHLRFLDHPVYRWCTYHHQYSPIEFTPISYNQSHLFFIIAGNPEYLYLEHYVSEGLSIIPPTNTYWNVPVMIIQVLDSAHLKASSLNKGWHNNIHLGTIIYQSHSHLTVNQDLANIFRSQPPVT